MRAVVGNGEDLQVAGRGHRGRSCRPSGGRTTGCRQARRRCRRGRPWPGRELRDRAGRRDPADLVGRELGEPQVAVGPGGDVERPGPLGGDRVLVDLPGRVDPGDPARRELGEPQVAVGTGGDPGGLAVLRGEGEVRRRSAAAAAGGGGEGHHCEQCRTSDPGLHCSVFSLGRRVPAEYADVSPQGGGFALLGSNSFNTPRFRQSPRFRRNYAFLAPAPARRPRGGHGLVDRGRRMGGGDPAGRSGGVLVHGRADRRHRLLRRADADLLAVRASMAGAGLAFETHDGDIQKQGSPCTDSRLDYVKGVFNGFAAPFVYTPGDNEWSDCPNPSSRLSAIRRTFFSSSKTLGKTDDDRHPPVGDAGERPLEPRRRLLRHSRRPRPQRFRRADRRPTWPGSTPPSPPPSPPVRPA